MTQALEPIRRRIESAEDLDAVVRVMKALAAARIRQCERAVESLAEYSRTIEAGLHVALRNRPKNVAIEPPVSRHRSIIAFGSDQGMCGSFNEQVASFLLEEIGTLGGAPEARTVLVVGSRLVGRLEDAGCAIESQLVLPSSVSGIASAVHRALLKVEELRFQKSIDEFLLIHHRPIAPAGSAPSKVQLLPIDRDWLASLARKRWPSRSLPTYSMNWRQLFSALIRQHLFVALYRAFAESMASENASRLASMYTAEKNIENHLSRLTIDYNQGRQQSITEELLDIVAGFETLTKDERRTQRDAEGR